MGRIAAEFVARFPDVELEVLSDNRVIDPRVDGVDVVIRINPCPRQDLIGRLLVRETTLLVASPRLTQPDHLLVDRDAPIPVILLPNQTADSTWNVLDGDVWRRFSPKTVLRVASLVVALEAARRGAGAALLPQTLVTPDLRSGALVALGRSLDRDIEIWALHTSRRLRSPKVSAFVEFLGAQSYSID